MKKIFLILIGVMAGGLLYYNYIQHGFDADKILANSVLKQRSFSGQAEEITTADGKIKAFFMAEHSVPLVAVSFGFERAGRAYEPKNGVALLAENVLLDGAGRYSREQLRQLMKEKGIKLSVSAHNDSLDFSLSYVKQFAAEAKEILTAILYAPRLEITDLDLARRQLDAVRKQQQENPRYHLSRLVDKHLYQNHPYGKENIPDARTLAQISAQDIRAYLKQFMAKDTLSVGISGDISAEEAAELLDEVFGKLADTSAAQALAELKPDYSAAGQSVEIPFSAQSFVVYYAPGVKRLDADFYPLYVADYILGGAGLNSRLNQAVREKEGLTYGIYSYFSNSDALDSWQIAFSAGKDKRTQALEIVNNEYQRFYEHGISADELAQAKQSLLASFNLRFSSLFNIAEMLKQMQRQQLGIDFLTKRQGYIEALSLQQVNEAIKKRMPPKVEGYIRLFYTL